MAKRKIGRWAWGLAAVLAIVVIRMGGRVLSDWLGVYQFLTSPALREIPFRMGRARAILDAVENGTLKADRNGRIALPASLASATKADLWRADLTGAALARADLRGARFSSAEMRGVDLRGANLRDTIFAPFVESTRPADLTDANLEQADLSGANLCRAVLVGARLRGARLVKSTLEEASLQGADLRAAELREADLTAARLPGADLRGADLTAALLYDADLRHANLRGTNFTRVDALEESDPRIVHLVDPRAWQKVTLVESSVRWWG